MEGFRKFLTKTNAIALAIGVIIGGAATTLVNSLVANLINPIIGVLLSGIDLSSALKIPLGLGQQLQPDGTTKAVPNELKLGAFIATLLNFVIVMFVAYQLAKIFAKDMLDDKK
jgi:large conductance mechanosensitive channel